ncbi:cytochrome b/b6 domain-containing protein [Aliiroseovarius sp. S1339]|uniref:cytochrome b/b6 domain-containing protein n=1 Tax=Aliiroseovarius sp. S1339 TaxID=2936990 RepID=UPI0020C035E7|nr:cytochrome b/b6 domain-containing protein [Aliiroseovarius sp. S1339]MCK8464400.1 cytochrome b/b6 domain-containing protein [Aliiroseovarius sp. S1339]
MSHKSRKQRVWDPVTRLFHWSLVVAVVTGWSLGRFGPTVLSVHYYMGYTVAALLVLRIYWGFRGPQPVRFRTFIYGPATTLVYIKRMAKRVPSHWPGHNPVGALSVFAMLAVLALQVATGLIADPDDFVNVGPLARWVEFDTARWAASAHRLSSKLLLALVGLHIGAILYYRFWKDEDLVRPMITGWKEVRDDHPKAPPKSDAMLDN